MIYAIPGYSHTTVNREFAIGVLVVIIIGAILVTEAGVPQEPFIAIDPVSNHTTADVFFITGTTNLPASGNPLYLQIYSGWFNPGGSGGGYQSEVPIRPGISGTNTWVCNVTPALWQMHGIGPRAPITTGAWQGEYIVTVTSPDPGIIANDSRFFTLFSPDDTGIRKPGGSPPVSLPDRTGLFFPGLADLCHKLPLCIIDNGHT